MIQFLQIWISSQSHEEYKKADAKGERMGKERDRKQKTCCDFVLHLSLTERWRIHGMVSSNDEQHMVLSPGNGNLNCSPEGSPMYTYVPIMQLCP